MAPTGLATSNNQLLPCAGATPCRSFPFSDLLTSIEGHNTRRFWHLPKLFRYCKQNLYTHSVFYMYIYSINIACQLLLPGVLQAFGRWFFAALLLTVSENLWHNAGGDAGLKFFEFVAAAAAAAMAHKDIKLNRNISELPQSDRKQRRFWPPRLIYSSNSDCQTVRKVRFVNARITSDF